MTTNGIDRNATAGGSGAAVTPVDANVIDAKGDLIVGTADNAVDNLTVGTNETRLVADSAQTLGVKWVADTTNYAINAKGDLLAGTAADTAAPITVGSDGYALRPSSGATPGLAWVPSGLGFTLEGGYLDWSVSGNVLTVAVKAWSGNNPSDSEPVFITFRSSTVATGLPVLRKLNAATSVSLNNTATIGTANSVSFRIWCVAFDDAGTVRLGLINCVTTSAGAGAGRDVSVIFGLRGWNIGSSTLIDNAADNAQTFYTNTAAVTSKGYATLGYATWESGLATAGTWSAGPTRAQLFGRDVPLPGDVIQVQRTQTGASTTGTTLVPADDTIPQITEGDQYMSQVITPSSASNVLKVSAQWYGSNNQASTRFAMSLHQDAINNALTTASFQHVTADFPAIIPLLHATLAATISATTFRIRVGGQTAGTTTFNGSAGARVYGGVLNSFLEVTEIMG